MSDPRIEELQREKLEIEISDLKKPWYKRKDYLQFLIPALITAGALIYAIVSGFFSTKYEQYQLQKAKLELEIQYFEGQKQQLITSNQKISQISDSLKGILNKQMDSIDRFKSNVSRIQTALLKAQTELRAIKSQKEDYTNQITQLMKEYANGKSNMQKNLQKSYISESKLQNDLKELNFKYQVLENDRDLYKFTVEKSLNNPFLITKEQKLKYSSWILDQQSLFLEESLKKSSTERNKATERLKKLQMKTDSLNAINKSYFIDKSDHP